MKAKLDELRSKYYTTEITVLDDEGNDVGSISVCIHGRNWDDFKPSDRELERAGVTREQYESKENRMLPNEWDGSLALQTYSSYCGFEWSHTERQNSYLVAKKIVEMLNEGS